MRGLVASALVLAAALASGARAAEFDYLYIRAHEGNASGGHAAVRFGADTFDFQHERGGWIALRRDDSRRFQHHYRALQNRAIEVSRVEATPETVALLRETFERRLLAQTRQRELLAALESDAALLSAWAGGDAPSLRVRGAGFFAAAADAAPAPPALIALRDAIAERHGADFLDARCAEASRTLREAQPEPLDVAALGADPLAVPFARETLSSRAGHALAALAACELLAHPRGLAPGVRAGEGVAPDPWLALDAPMRARLEDVRGTLLASAMALAASRRPDWGETLLLAAARSAALDESLAAGRLIALDAFPPGAKQLEVGARRRVLLPQLQADVRQDLLEARRRVFSAEGFRETAWGELEAAVTRSAELRAVADGADRMRIASGPLVPDAAALRALPRRPEAERAALARAAETARADARAYRARLEARTRYELVGRNCVSELFRTVDFALSSAAGGAPVAGESERRLGGYVDPVGAANFVPFVSSHRVRARWNVAERIHLPSLREETIARDGSAIAALRESNVVTASFYEPAERSSFFVFFTDGASWPLRPLLGAVNLAASLARSGVGVLQLPFDGGEGLRSGMSGALWSAPELLFVNIRKGTNEYVPPAKRLPPG
jgi:hypothetical protein